MITIHSSNDNDAYKKPQFSLVNKLKRVVWKFSWLLLCRFSPIFFHSWRSLILKLFGAKIGQSNFIYPNVKIWAPWLLETDDVATIGPGVEIYNPGGLYIGSHAILSQDSYICGATHDYNTKDFTYLSRKITIQKYAWICAKAIVLPGVTCYEGSVLGAGSIASKDLDSWTVYSGNPAIKVKERTKFL